MVWKKGPLKGGLQLIGGANWSTPTKALASGLVGGAVSAGEGGKFLPGFLAAGFSSYFTSDLGWAGRWRGPVAIVLGGASSVLGGGKFANGAITAAFAYAASSLASRQLTTGSPAGPGSGAVNEAAVDLTHGYKTYDEAQLALKGQIEAASSSSGWEYGGFVLEKGGAFYLSQLGTSQNPLGISWNIGSIKSLSSSYDMLAYDHTHLQSIIVDNRETGMNFSNGDVDLHDMEEGNGVYRGTFVDWHSSMFYLPGGTQYGHNMLGIPGLRCTNFPNC